MATLTPAQMVAKIAQLEASNALLVASQPEPRDMTIKVSDKTGCIVVGGCTGRWPVSLYRTSWAKLLSEESVKAITTFIKTYESDITAQMAAAGKTDRTV